MPSDGAPAGLCVVHAATHEHTGAGAAAVRIHRAVTKAGLRSELLVLHGTGAEPGVEVVVSPRRRLPLDLLLRAENALLGLQKNGEAAYRSLGLVRGPGLAALRRRRADVVHLHWIPGLLGVADVPDIAPPLVWTFHDQWPMCGAEHYTASARPREGYTPGNRVPGSGGLDLDRWAWERKRARWRELAPVIACPSRWLAGEIRASALFGGREVHVLPNPLDTGLWRPQDRAALRARLGLPVDRTLILFSAWSASTDRRKGFHVLSAALARLAARGLAADADVVLLGATGSDRIEGFSAHWMGHVADEGLVSRICAACDVLALPSLQDNYPNTLAEGMACGLAAVASDIGGIPDLVQHGKTGLLAPPGDAERLAEQLALVLRDAELRARLAEAGRRAVVLACDERTVAARYLELYRLALARRAAASR
ncbi:MAG TPA: glycosyltransferase [Burkholderiales bacterium]|nr:glycosyltransferase [Burkholderiales bacterium]